MSIQILVNSFITFLTQTIAYVKEQLHGDLLGDREIEARLVRVGWDKLYRNWSFFRFQILKLVFDRVT